MNDEEIMAFVKAGNVDALSADDFLLAVEEGIYGAKASLKDAAKVMRECIKNGKRFKCAYATGESCDEEHAHEPYIFCWAE